MALHPVVAAVTDRIRQRSAASRAAYLAQIEQFRAKGPLRQALGCTNLAHAYAAAPAGDKIMLRELRQPNLAIVTSYNDMLSAHQPFERFPRTDQAAQRARPVRPPRWPAACRRCATASRRASRAWSCRCSAAT